MRIQVAYGENVQEAQLDWIRFLGEIEMADAAPLADVHSAVREALASPHGLEQAVPDVVQPGERVAILVSDAFRKTGADQFLPPLLDALSGRGVKDKDLLFMFATGTHRPPSPIEQAAILGPEIYRRFEGQIYVHDAYAADNFVYVGATSRGTPVKINKRVRECDRIIATGTVVFHYFGGFGGGRKSILPGIASEESIRCNHGLNLDPKDDRINPAVRIGALDGNPVSEDMLEGARLAKVDAILNTVMNRQGQIAGVFAGDLEAAHRAAVRFAEKLFATPIDERADLVIASSDGTKNFVQSHKALFNAHQAMKSGGRIILLARCEEGLGGGRLARWLGLGDRASIIAELRREGEIYGQTALSTRYRAPSAFLVTDLPDEDVALIGAQRAQDLQEALYLAKHHFTTANIPEPTCYLMPAAPYTVPFPRD